MRHVPAALPYLTPLLFTLTGLALARLWKTESGRPGWVFWAIFTLVFVAWAAAFGNRMYEVSQESAFEERKGDVGRIIELEIKEGQKFLDQLTNDARFDDWRRCRDQELPLRFRPPHHEWRQRVARMLADQLPGSQADQRFASVMERRLPGACGELDWIYWRHFDLLSNLRAIWEGLDQYCRRVGPTCQRV